MTVKANDLYKHAKKNNENIIRDIIDTLERNTDEELLYKYLNNICVMYKYRKFDVSMYREFNSSSKFRCNVDGKTMLLDNIGYDYLKICLGLFLRLPCGAPFTHLKQSLRHNIGVKRL